SVISSTLPRRSVSTGPPGSACSALIRAPCSGKGGAYPRSGDPAESAGRGGWPRAGRSGREQAQVGLAISAQDLRIDLHALHPARDREHTCLRLDDLRSQDAPAGAERGIEADALEVAAQLLDGVDRDDPLDLHRDPLVLLVLAHQIDGPDVGGPLALDQPETLSAPLGRVGQELLELTLDALLLERQQRVELMLDVGENLGDCDVQ